MLALLSGSKLVNSYDSSYEANSARTLHQLTARAADLLAPMLCETERFFLKPATPPDVLLPLKWDTGDPWSFSVQVARDDVQAAYIVQGFLAREGSQIPIAEPLLFGSGLVFFRDRVARFDAGKANPWVRMLRSAGNLTVPFDQRTDFMDEIAQFSDLPPIELPDGLRIEQRALENPPELRFVPCKTPGPFIRNSAPASPLIMPVSKYPKHMRP